MNSTQGSDWQRTSLGDLFGIKHGFAFKGEFFSDSGNLIVLTPGNFEPDGGIKLKGDKEKFYKGTFPNEFLLSHGDLLVVMTDLTQHAPILGSAAFIPEDNRFLHNQRLGKIVNLKKDRIAERFLYHLFNSPHVRSAIKASATGATVRHTAPERIYRIEVDLPPLLVQDRIASILSAYDDLIENNTRRIAILEEMAQALYQEWFVHFRFPGHEHVPLAPSPLGPIPEGWEVMTVGQAFEITGGGTPSKKVSRYWDNGTIDWFTPSDLTSAKSMFVERSGAHITQDGLRESSARLFPARSVMMTSRATLGVVSICTGEACTNQGFITCIPNDHVPVCLIYFWIRQNIDTITSLATGATFKEISKSVFRTIQFLMPLPEIAERYQDIAEPMTGLILALQRKNANLRTTRDLLLPRLISGEIDVSALSQEPIPEAAD